MTYHGVCNLCNTTGAGTAYLSGASKLAPVMYMHIWGTSCLCCQLHISPCLVLCCDVRYDFRVKTMFGSSLTFVLSGVHAFLMLFVFCLLIPASNTMFISDDVFCLRVTIYLARCQPYHCFYYLPLVLACHYPHIHPYIQQYCSYTVEVSSLLAEEARVPGSAVYIRYSLLCQDIHVHRATSRN